MTTKCNPLEDLTTTITKDLARQFDLALMENLTNALFNNGFEFNDELELRNFIRNRVSRMVDVRNINNFTLFLDLNVYLFSYNQDFVMGNIINGTITAHCAGIETIKKTRTV